ncbi:MAG: glycosyltransferase family A protein [Bacteroidales bacterium]|nr:glycosyltransferase family A protein [Bacteroidales bacterium]
MNENKNINIPFFSVVIPVYNKGPHIHRSISSVLNQTYQNFELILVNDASTDNSLEEIKKYTDDRICLFQRTEPGPGGYAARNLGIEKANGEWVAFLDADDEWYPHHLEKMHALAQKYPDVYFMGCGWKTKNNGVKKENKFYKEYKNNGTLKISVEDYLKHGIKRKLPMWTSVACVKRKSSQALNLFPENSGAKRGGDLHAWLKMMCYHKKMAWSNHIGAVYYLDSITMVTKISPQNPGLLVNKDVFSFLSNTLNKKEQALLKKYFNKLLKNAWLNSAVVKSEKINTCSLFFLENIIF